MKLSIITKAKMKVNSVALCAASSLSAGLATIGLGFCDVDAGASMKRFIKIVFNVLMFGGIIMAAIGAVMLIRTIVAMASGEQAQPGALGKGIGLLLGGILLMAAKFLVTKIIGQDPTTIDFMNV